MAQPRFLPAAAELQVALSLLQMSRGPGVARDWHGTDAAEIEESRPAIAGNGLAGNNSRKAKCVLNGSSRGGPRQGRDGSMHSRCAGADSWGAGCAANVGPQRRWLWETGSRAAVAAG